MNEELKNKYPNLFGSSFSKDDAYGAVADVVADTVSGVVGPAAAAVGSMVDQALTNKSLVDLRSNKERFANMLNFEPRSKAGAEASEYLQGKLGEGAAAVEEFWGKYKPDSLLMMDTAIDIGTKAVRNQMSERQLNMVDNTIEGAELIGGAVGAVNKVARAIPDLPPTDPDFLMPQANMATAGVPSSVTPELDAPVSTQAMVRTSDEDQDIDFDDEYEANDADNLKELEDDMRMSDQEEKFAAVMAASDPNTPDPYMTNEDMDAVELQRMADEQSSYEASGAEVEDLNIAKQTVADYVGGLRDGYVNAGSQSLLHLRDNKIAEVKVLKESFPDVPEIVVTEALTKFKRPKITEDNKLDAFVYLAIKRKIEATRYKKEAMDKYDIDSKEDYNPDPDAARKTKIRDIEAELNTIGLGGTDSFNDFFKGMTDSNYDGTIDVQGMKEALSPFADQMSLADLADELEDFGGYYRAYDLTDASTVSDMKSLMSKEQSRYSRFKKKMGNRPDVTIIKSKLGWADEYEEGATRTFQDGQERVENKSKINEKHSELQDGYMSTSSNMNFTTRQKAFGGDEIGNVKYATIPAADYAYQTYNISPKLYDTVNVANTPAASLEMPAYKNISADDRRYQMLGKRARLFDASLTGGTKGRGVKIPHSRHLEDETAFASPMDMEFKNILDNPKLKAEYEASAEANRRLTGPTQDKFRDELYGLTDKTATKSRLKGLSMWGIDEVEARKLSTLQRISTLMDRVGVRDKSDFGFQSTTNKNTTSEKTEKLSPKAALVVYKEWRYMLNEAADSIKHNKGMGSRGPYVGILEQFDTHANQGNPDRFQILADSLPKEQADNILKLRENILKFKAAKYSKRGEYGAEKYQSERLPAANAIKELTRKFNEGGLVEDEMEAMGFAAGGLPERTVPYGDSTNPSDQLGDIEFRSEMDKQLSWNALARLGYDPKISKVIDAGEGSYTAAYFPIDNDATTKAVQGQLEREGVRRQDYSRVKGGDIMVSSTAADEPVWSHEYTHRGIKIVRAKALEDPVAFLTKYGEKALDFLLSGRPDEFTTEMFDDTSDRTDSILKEDRYPEDDPRNEDDVRGIRRTIQKADSNQSDYRRDKLRGDLQEGVPIEDSSSRVELERQLNQAAIDILKEQGEPDKVVPKEKSIWDIFN